jgi:hypothetical protein
VVATQLTLYNGALTLCKARRIASLSVNEESRRLLDDVWDRGAVNTCLEQGLWNHAMRTIQIDCDAAYSDPFNAGWNRFTKPDDWVRIVQCSIDPSFSYPDLQYQDEGLYIFSPQNTLYIRYISNDASFGNNYSLWPSSFERYVEGYLAYSIIGRLTGGTTDKQQMDVMLRQLLSNALSKDAMREPTKFPPETSWNSSRRGFRMGRGNRDYGGM